MSNIGVVIVKYDAGDLPSSEFAPLWRFGLFLDCRTARQQFLCGAGRAY